MTFSQVIAALIWGLALPCAAMAQTSEQERFIKANILAVFYHELGHAVIDVEDLPIYGQEEDAADVFSIFMIDALYEEELARSLAHHTAQAFRAETEFDGQTDAEENWSGVHGLSEQRFYNSVCIFYGANRAMRRGFADELGLPESRRETCGEEYEQANHSWGAVLDDLIARGAGTSVRFDGQGLGSRAAELLAHEVAYLNSVLQLSAPIIVVVEPCDEANAYYHTGERLIQFCEEFETYFEDMARWLL